MTGLGAHGGGQRVGEAVLPYVGEGSGAGRHGELVASEGAGVDAGLPGAVPNDTGTVGVLVGAPARRPRDAPPVPAFFDVSSFGMVLRGTGRS